MYYYRPNRRVNGENSDFWGKKMQKMDFESDFEVLQTGFGGGGGGSNSGGSIARMWDHCPTETRCGNPTYNCLIDVLQVSYPCSSGHTPPGSSK